MKGNQIDGQPVTEEQLLKEGYSQMADLNLSLAAEAFPFECEACDCNEVYLSSKNNNE